MKTYYLFRHGETYYSKNVVPYGENESTAEILPESYASINKIALFLKNLKVDYALRSELLRCKETAEIIEKKTNFKFTPEPLLNEFTEKDFTQFLARMVSLHDKLNSLKAENIVICTHGANIAAMKRLLLNKDFKAHDLMYYPKTGVIVKIEGNNLTELDFR